jgi:DNA-binding PadR family transcriptional regulator
MSVSYALLGLLEGGPRYGYELKRLYDEHLGTSQPVKFGQVYTTLGRLRRDALVDISSIEAGAGPDRKLYLITDEGVESFERWLTEPEAPEAHGRNALFTKVVLALMSGRDPDEILDTQRAAHLERMRELTERRRGAELRDRLACDFELFHLEADLRWIELAGKRVQPLHGEIENRRDGR